MTFDPSSLLGAAGGQLALAFAAGAAAGYGFCLRTVYKMLGAHKDKEHSTCLERIEILEKEKNELQVRMSVMEDRYYTGQLRQAAQIRESTAQILGPEKLGRTPE